MEWLTSWFEWFSNLCTTIFDFFNSLVENLIFLFKYLKLAFDIAISFVDSMPTWLQTVCFVTISVSLLFIIIGRSTGGKKND